MPWLIEKQRRWLKRHGEQKNGSDWTCKKTGESINCIPFQHSIPNTCFGPMDFLQGHDGNPINRTIIMLYCTSCGQEPEGLPFDFSIDDAVEVR